MQVVATMEGAMMARVSIDRETLLQMQLACSDLMARAESACRQSMGGPNRETHQGSIALAKRAADSVRALLAECHEAAKHTPREADDIMKVLDAGHEVTMFKNAMGSYTAEAGGVETDDFTPSQALYRLAEKVTTGRIA